MESEKLKERWNIFRVVRKAKAKKWEIAIKKADGTLGFGNHVDNSSIYKILPGCFTLMGAYKKIKGLVRKNKLLPYLPRERRGT